MTSLSLKAIDFINKTSEKNEKTPKTPTIKNVIFPNIEMQQSLQKNYETVSCFDYDPVTAPKKLHDPSLTINSEERTRFSLQTRTQSAFGTLRSSRQRRGDILKTTDFTNLLNLDEFKTEYDSSLKKYNFTFFQAKPTLLSKPRLLITKLLVKKKPDNFLMTNSKRIASKGLKKKYKEILQTVKIEKGENRDKVNSFDFEYASIYRKIRHCLLNDINPVKEENKDNFYKYLENKVNYEKDISLYPHFKNLFQFKNKNLDTIEGLTKALCYPNCLSKEVEISMNKERRKLIMKKDREKDIKFILDQVNEQREKNLKKKKHYEEQAYDFEDYFNKNMFYRGVHLVPKKIKQICFNFDKIKRK